MEQYYSIIGKEALNKERNSEEFRSLLKKLIGTRTYKEFSNDTGISLPYIYDLLNGHSMPSRKMIEKVTNPSSHPQNGVTIDSLMISAGFVKKESSYDRDSLAADNIVEVHSPLDIRNPDEFKSCLIDLIGTRSYREVSKDTGISISYISKLVNGRVSPSIDYIRKLTDPQNNPQNGITYKEMLESLGVKPHLIAYAEKLGTLSFFNKSYADKVLYNSDSSVHTINSNDAVNGIPRENEWLFITVYSALQLKGIDCSLTKTEMVLPEFITKKKIEETLPMYKILPDLILTIRNAPIKSWHFMSWPYMFANANLLEYKLNLILLYNIPCDTKLSIVLTHQDMFDFFKRLQGILAYKGELSVILVDEYSRTVKDEVYLSHYGEDDSSEIYLVEPEASDI